MAALLPQMLAVHGQPLRYLCGLRPMPELDVDLPTRPARPVDVRESTDGWMASLLARRRLPAADAGEIDAQRYLDTVTEALADGRLLGGEAQTLARLGGSAGLGAAQVEAPARAAAGAPARGRAHRRDPDDRADPAAADGGRARSAGRRTSTSCAPPRRRTWSPARSCPSARRDHDVHPLPPSRARPLRLPAARGADGLSRHRTGRRRSGGAGGRATMRRGMSTGREMMRVSDAERQVAADRLRAAMGEGRLDLLEYDNRLGLRLPGGHLRRPRQALHRPPGPRRAAVGSGGRGPPTPAAAARCRPPSAPGSRVCRSR